MKRGLISAVGFALALVSASATAQPAQGGSVDDAIAELVPDIAPPDVYLAVLGLQYELAALRYVSGRSSAGDSVDLRVDAAEPRHVFYQAQVLFRKANQLGEEFADRRTLPLEEVNADWRRSSPRPMPEGREIAPADVLQVITDVRDRIKAVLLLLNVNIAIQDPPERDGSKEPKDVLAQILKANRDINLLLHREFRMRDVYEQVLLAINYAADLGAGYPSREKLAERKQPIDIYQRLLDCLSLLREVGESLDVSVIDLRAVGNIAADDVTAADTFVLTTILISDLAHMAQHTNAEHTTPPRGEYRRPRYLLPSDVFDLVGVLEAQLAALALSAATDAGPLADDGA